MFVTRVDPERSRFRLLAVLLLISIIGAVGGRAWSVRPRHQAPPATDAQPGEVVLAYYRMVNARDCNGSKALLVGEVGGALCPSWWQDYSVKPRVISETPYRRWEKDVINYPQEELVVASLVVEQHLTGAVSGQAEKSFLLVRSENDQPWRIVEIGGMV